MYIYIYAHIYTHVFIFYFIFIQTLIVVYLPPNHYCSTTIQLFSADFDAVLLLLDS